MLTKEELPACPVATTVQLIGSKWKLLILRNLLARPWRFNELKKNLEGISQKVLTDSLRSLEEDGIVTRTVYPEVPPRKNGKASSGKPLISRGCVLRRLRAARRLRGIIHAVPLPDTPAPTAPWR